MGILGSCQALSYNPNGLVKSPSSRQGGISQDSSGVALHPRPVEFSPRETAKPVQQGESLQRASTHGSFLSEFTLSLAKGALPQTGFRFAQLTSGAFYCAAHFGDFLRSRHLSEKKGEILLDFRSPYANLSFVVDA
jgi:hypothetical protein